MDFQTLLLSPLSSHGAKRATLVEALDAADVQSLIHYPIPPCLQKAYAQLGMVRGSLSIAERLADEVLSLPLSEHLSPADVDAVADAICSAPRGSGR